VAVCFCAVLALLVPVWVLAEGITVQLDFAPGGVSLSKSGGYDVVKLAGCELSGEPGEPLLPVKAVYVWVPADFVVGTVSVLRVERKELDGTFKIVPAGPVLPMPGRPLGACVVPDPKTYRLNRLVPASFVRSQGTGWLAGYQILSLVVFPVQYLPAQGKLFLNTSIELGVFGSKRPAAPLLPARRSALFDAATKRQVASLVINPEVLSPSGGVTPLQTSELVDVLIVTVAQYVDALEALRGWLYSKGYIAETLCVDSISDAYEGRDVPERIRNCIKDYYQNRGLGWVILWGDTEDVPTRVGYAFTYGKEYDSEDFQQCDFYFSDLDGSWNADGDDLWGEYIQDEIDMYPDVFVGRVPVGTVHQAWSFVSKLLEYEGVGEEALPLDYETRVMFWACQLDDEPTWGGDCKDKIVASGIFPEYIELSTFYDRDGTSGKDNILEALNSGFGLINNVGHSTYWAASAKHDVPDSQKEYITRIDFSRLRNAPRYSVLYSTGCLFGSIDKDCLAERFINCRTGGGVAVIANSRYGWYSSGIPGSGPSEIIDKAFFDELFRPATQSVGEAFFASKCRYVGYAKRSKGGWFGCFRWIIYGMNLLGSPLMPVWTSNPGRFDVEHGSIYRSKRKPLDVVVRDDSGRPVGGALVCLTDGGYAFDRAITDQDGSAQLEPRLEADCTLRLTVTKANFLPYSGSVIGILNSDPVLSEGKVEPRYGRPGERFEFSVRYSDEDGDSPAVIKVKVAGRYYDLELDEGQPSSGRYSAQVQVGQGGCSGAEFHFFALDGHGAFARLPESGEFSGPGLDVTLPKSRALTPKYSTGATLAVEYVATDDCSGVVDVGLWYRKRGLAWRLAQVRGSGEEGSLPFVADSEGIYDFFAVATDGAGNREKTVAKAESFCIFDWTPPSSRAICDEVSSSGVIVVRCVATDSTSGVGSVGLWYRLAAKGGKGAGWRLAEKRAWHPGLSFLFEAPEGPGDYELISLATDLAGNREAQKGQADCSCTLNFKPIEVWVSTQNPTYRFGDKLSLLAGYRNRAGETVVDAYVAITTPDLRDLYLPDFSFWPSPFCTQLRISAHSSAEGEIFCFDIPESFPTGWYVVWAMLVESPGGEAVSEVASSRWQLLGE